MSAASRLTSIARALLPRPEVRADASAAVVSGAAVSNYLSNLGTARDSSATARPNTTRHYLTDEELVALLRGTLYRRIVELKPRWATSRGWDVTDDTDEERPLAAELKRLKVRRIFREADAWARALGEARILLVTDDDADLSEPLEPERVRRLHRLEVLDRREFTPLRHNTDAQAGRLGEPDLYQVHPWRTGVALPQGAVVHASRLLRFYGDELPPSEEGRGTIHWGADAIGQTLWDGIRHLSQTGSGGARLAQELSVAVFRSKPSPAAGDQREGFLARLQTLNLMKSIANAVLLFDGEDFTRVPANPTGFRDLSEHARLELALLTGYPLTLLFGIAPGGLNTDGESWQVAWFEEVSAYREERYRDPLERIVEILYHTDRGGVPDEWDIEFRPLGELTEKEKAEIRLIHTQADSAAIMDGVLTPSEARSRYTQPGGYRFELEPVDDEPDAMPGGLGMAPPEAEEEVRRMIEEGLQGGGAPADEPLPDDPAASLDGAHRPTNRGPVLPSDFRGDAVDPDSGLIVLLPAPAPSLSVPVPLEQPDAPHVTLLYLGEDHTDEQVAEVVEAVGQAARDMETAVLEHGRVVAFPGGEDGVPVVIEFDAWPLTKLHDRLLRSLAHVVTAKQHARFRPHLTLGYAPSLTSEQLAQLMEIDASEVRVPVVALEVRRGAELVATIPVGG